MTTSTGLEAFTLYLDPEDSEDASIIRFLKPKAAKKRASAEIRRAILVYLEVVRAGNSYSPHAFPPAPPQPSFVESLRSIPLELSLSSTQEKKPATNANTKSVQEARRAFMKR